MRNINPLKIKWNLIFEIIFFVFLFIFTISMAKKLPLNFDEAFNLQVPINLLRYGQYNTVYGSRSFDGFSTITTGPTVLFPIFLICKIIGLGVLRGRLVNVAYFMLTFVFLYMLLKKVANRYISFIFIIMLLSIPTIFGFGITVLGEIPLLFFIISAIYFWKENDLNILSLILFGLGVVTKVYFILFIIPLCIMIFIEELNNNKFIYTVQRIIVSINVFIFPIIIWEITKFFIIGRQRYPTYLKEMSEVIFLNSQTSNIVDTSNLFHRLSLFFSSIFPNVPILFSCFVFIVINVIIIQKILRRMITSKILLIYLLSSTYFLWWLFVTSNANWRHILPFAILIIFLAIEALYDQITKSKLHINTKRILILLSLILIIILIIIPGITKRINEAQSNSLLIEQRDFADIVRSYSADGYIIGVYGWWQAPEISFLSGGLKFINIIDNPQIVDQEKTVIIFTKIHEILSTDNAESLKMLVSDPIYISEEGNYILYKTRKVE